ncbi:hypothetical protein NEDG_00100 [Nematocida displodere]|uniref:Uncharacterized protein n=1 Tax=Nematocida displodere TaxID=1805483 RepID=A0A177EI25_9MICR|nr:hypothetical protein NEDG_00100 [Nematocida displodere]
MNPTTIETLHQEASLYIREELKDATLPERLSAYISEEEELVDVIAKTEHLLSMYIKGGEYFFGHVSADI